MEENPDQELPDFRKWTILHLIMEFRRNNPELADTIYPKYQIFNECFSFFAAGHDTTTSTTCFLLEHLAQNPEVQQKVLFQLLLLFIHSSILLFKNNNLKKKIFFFFFDFWVNFLDLRWNWVCATTQGKGRFTYSQLRRDSTTKLSWLVLLLLLLLLLLSFFFFSYYSSYSKSLIHSLSHLISSLFLSSKDHQRIYEIVSHGQRNS